MKRRHLLLVALSLILSICLCFCLAACDSCGDEPVQLATPVVTVADNGVASWEAVENASGYAYKISDGEEQTTDKTSVTLTDGQSVSVKAVGDGKAFSDSEYSEAKSYNKPAPQPTQLSKPVVTLDGAVASWAAVPNASGYKYSLDGGTTWVDATGTSVTLTDGQSIVVKAIGNGTTYTDSPASDSKTYNKPAPQPTQLTKPVVSLDGAVASWTADEHATKYQYKLGDGEWTDATGTSVTLTDGQTVIVKAIGDGTNYSDSPESDPVTYTATSEPDEPVALAKPVVTVDQTTGVASWAAVEHADGYKYSTDNGATWSNTITATKTTLEKGQTVIVKAIGDGTNYSDSPESEPATYNNDDTPDTPVTLTKPVVTVDQTTGVASWTAVANASGYKYSVDGGTTWADVTGTSVTLTKGQTVTVKAIGDGTNYSDSPASDPATYNDDEPTPPVPTKLGTPVVTIDENGLASWAAVTNATKYTVKVGDTETDQTERTKQLTDGQTIQVKAVGDGTNYATGDYSAVKTYNQGTIVPQPEKLIAPTVTISDTGLASWQPIEHAIKYTYTINDGEEKETTECSVQLLNGQKILVKAVGDGENYLTSNNSAARSYIVSKLAATLSFADVANRTSQDADSQVWEQNGIKFTNSKANSITNVSNNTNPVRLYKDSSIKIEYENMVKIVFNCNNASYATALNGSFTRSSVAHSVDGKVVTVKFSVKLDSFDLAELSAQVRLDSIEVYVEKVATPLAKPVVTIDDDGNASWEAVEHASGYRYVINDGTPVETTETRVPLLDNNATIKVCALGDGEDWSISPYSEVKTYTWTTVQLSAPTLTINNAGKVTWAAVDHATKYVYVIITDNVESAEQETTECGLPAPLTDKQSVKVKTIGARRYLSSDFGTTETYDKPTEATKLNKDLFVVSIARDGTVTVSHPNASSINYKINGGAETPLSGSTVKLNSTQSVTFIAVGDGTIYTNSDETAAFTYTAPHKLDPVTGLTLTVEGTEAGKVVASWTADEHATKYAYIVGEAGQPVETEETSVTLENFTEGTSFKVMAVGDNTTVNDGNFGDCYDSGEYCDPVIFNIDNEKTYNVADMVKIAVYYGGTKPSKTFTVSGVVSVNTAYDTKYGNIDITLKEGNAEFVVFRAKAADTASAEIKSQLSSAKANDLAHYTVNATGNPFVYSSSGKPDKIEFDSGCLVTDITLSAKGEAALKAVAKEAADKLLDAEETAIKANFPATSSDGSFDLPTATNTDISLNWTFVNKSDFNEDDIAFDQTSVMVTQTDTALEIKLSVTLSIQISYAGKTEPYPRPVNDLIVNVLAEGSKQLDQPVVTINDSGLASWDPVTDATGYKYSLDGGATWTDATGTSQQLSENETIIVKAISTEANILDSEPSVAKKFVKRTTVSVKISDCTTMNNTTLSAGSTVGTKHDTFKLTEDSKVYLTITRGSKNSGTVWGTAPNNDIRMYQENGCSFTINAAEGLTIVSVKFTFTVANKGTLKDINSTTTYTSGTVITVDASSKTFTVGNSGTATNGQVKITAIEVVYKSA